jgi:hypothetical protein
VRRYDSTYDVEIAVTRQALAFLNEHLTGNALDLVVQFSGWMRVHGIALDGSPVDHWETVGTGRNAWVSLQVARSDWYTRVLEPIGIGKFVAFEMPIPSVEAQEFQQALVHLAEAERQYVTGSDPGVFSSCRAALDALPGAKKRIYDVVDDERKRTEIDDLARQIGEYLHTGRHVAEDGAQKGEFPVDHRDAEFALATTRMLVAYTAKLLS